MGLGTQEDPAHRAGGGRAALADRARSCWPQLWPAWPRRVGGVRSRPIHDPREFLVPFKANAARRHHIPKQRYRVTNWAEYDAALRQRGSLTVWFSEDAIAAWRAVPRTTPGGQPHYSVLAIATALTLRAVFRLALRQTEGLIGSILHLLGLELAVPDHTTLMWTAQKEPWLLSVHGTSARRSAFGWTMGCASWFGLAAMRRTGLRKTPNPPERLHSQSSSSYEPPHG
jgi:hypothetical protein